VSALDLSGRAGQLPICRCCPPAQSELFPSKDPEPEILTEKFLAILNAAAEDPEDALRKEVQKGDCIGPMVHREVNVGVEPGPRRSLQFIDIELDE
jgi:hypothetical protein